MSTMRYDYHSINMEDLMVLDGDTITEENMNAYIPSYLLFATPKRSEKKTLNFIQKKVHVYRKKYYKKYLKSKGSQFYLAPVIQNNQFQVFYIDKKESIYIAFPDLIKYRDTVDFSKFEMFINRLKETTYHEKLKTTPLFLKIEIFINWFEEFKHAKLTEAFSIFLDSLSKYLLDLYEYMDYNYNDILSMKIENLFHQIHKYHEEENFSIEGFPKYVYGFIVTNDFLHYRDLNIAINKPNFYEYIWFETPEEAVAYKKRDYHIGAVIRGCIKNESKIIYHYKEQFYIVLKQNIIRLEAIEGENVNETTI